MVDISFIAEKVRTLISENLVENAIEFLLQKKMEQQGFQDDIILISARLKEIKSQEIKGILSFENRNLEKNKIRNAILDFIRELEASKQIQTEFNVFRNWDKNISGITTISGKWRDPSDNDVVFYEQKGNAVIGVYDFGERKKTGYYQGYIYKDILSYRWKWFNQPLIGYGQMIINTNNLDGNWWYYDNERYLEDVSYEYLGTKMPNWLTSKDLKNLWKKSKKEFFKSY